MTVQSLINGKVGDQVSIFDRGLLYGDGVFETMAMLGRRLALWHEHMQRLQSACEVLGFSFPGKLLLEKEIRQLIGSHEQGATLKITLTRGVGERGYRPVRGNTPTRIISIHDGPDLPKNYIENGIRLRCCDMRLATSKLAGLKHLNRLEQVLAQAEWQPEQGIQEGLMLNHDNHVIEGTMTNVFIVKNEVLITPDLTHAGVAGVMRRYLMDIAQNHNIEIRESHLSLADVKNADEVFVTNSVIGIWPVRQFDDVLWPAPGDITKRLVSLLDIHRKTSGIVV
ncbi:MAG: aminodeoxychorismate lyase [Gammaproteobacteria bacterium]|nr:MAG: aminodeoxychorismate lyase [Gammaproteobacteria bacterium]